MLDTRERLSPVTVAMHWIIGLAMIGLIVLGLLLEDMPKDSRGYWIGIHKEFGILVLALACLRAGWRWRNGFPLAVAAYRLWEHMLAALTHWLLLLGTLAMPVSGLMMSIGGGHPTNVFGLFTIPPLEQKNKLLGGIGHEVHELLGYALIVGIGLHVLAAVKHHVVDRDPTLRRMAGASVKPTTNA